ncbi:MAG: DUF2520 domain-containing protein [Deltaproteobacteria bacterium]|jgi:predicted short-subunit dehydrogenase-like oxidoreductase (DUF2520 family)|nr:DUF2520 domain-containing protein [Deltaproteobacteria bacterium]
MKIGFIGAGKAGFCLGQYLARKGLAPAGYYSKTPASALEAARLTGSKAFESAAGLIDECGLIFFTVPDGLIGPVWEQVSCGPVSGKIAAHLSGSLSSDVFSGHKEKGASAVSLHPLMAISDKYQSHKLLDETVFSIEGDPEAAAEVSRLVRSLGNEVFPLDKKHKTLYHCAAAFVSNFSVALAFAGAEMLEKCGLIDAQGALWKLMLNNSRSIAEYGPVQALTGPVERGDCGTAAAHLSVLEGEDRELYRLLALKLVQVSHLKHPERDYGPLEEILRQGPAPFA